MKAKERRAIRNKPLKRIRVLFVLMFMGLTANLLYFALVESDQVIINSYNPRLEAIEASVIRGDILDRNGKRLAYSEVTDGIQSRIYPYSNIFAHTVGYVGSGKNGLEGYHDLNLIQSNNSFTDTLTAPFKQGMPKGNSVITTLDSDLQTVAHQLLEGKRGAVVAIEPATGEILAMVSLPDYDPNSIDVEMDGLLSQTENVPLLNRSTQGLYPPGSTYKVITTTAYLENNNLNDYFHFCEGELFVGQKVIHCYNSKSHGRIDLEGAFAQSCNTAFAKMIDYIEVDRLAAVSEQFYYNQPIEMEIPVASSSFTLDETGSVNEVVETLIGQGKTLVTPLNNAMIACAVANGGSVYKPHLTSSVVSNEGDLIDAYEPSVLSQVLTSDMAWTLSGFMEVTSDYGTAKSLDTSHYSIASKTGTAENAQGEDHAWYIGYAPADNPQIALAIIVENSGSSSVNAVPIADALYKNYLNR